MFLKHLWNKNFPYVHCISLRTRLCWPSLEGNLVICILFLDFVRFAIGKWTGIWAWWTTLWLATRAAKIYLSLWCVISWFCFPWNVKRECRKLFFVTRDQKVLRNPWGTWIFYRYSWFYNPILHDSETQVLRIESDQETNMEPCLSHSRFCFLNTLLLV